MFSVVTFACLDTLIIAAMLERREIHSLHVVILKHPLLVILLISQIDQMWFFYITFMNQHDVVFNDVRKVFWISLMHALLLKARLHLIQHELVA